MAARTDLRLRRALEPVFQLATEENQALATELSPGSGFSRPQILTTVIWAIQGAAMDAFVTPEIADVEGLLTTLTEFAQSTET